MRVSAAAAVAPSFALRFNMSEPPPSAKRQMPKPGKRPGDKRRGALPPEKEPHSYSSVGANPYANFERVKHWHMLMMLIGCTCGGIIAGRLVEVDEEEVRRTLLPPFDRDEIEKHLAADFEFRPDLAPTMLRYAFAFAAERARQEGDLPPACPATAPVNPMTAFDACSSMRGMQEVDRILDSIIERYPESSRADIVAVAAIAAIRFLKGPADKIAFRWGRVDPGQESVPKTPMEKIFEKPEKKDTYVMSGANDNIRIIDPLLKIMPTLNAEEAFALMAAHAVGEFHEEVSGVPNGPTHGRVSRHKYFLSIHYYQVLMDMMHELKPAAIPDRPRNKPDQPTPPEMLAGTAQMVHPTKKTNITRTGFVTKDEVESLVLDDEGREIVTSFASDLEMWKGEFARGMEKLLDTGYKNLRWYVTPQMRDEQKKARERALQDLPPPALMRERGEASPTKSRLAIEEEKRRREEEAAAKRKS